VKYPLPSRVVDTINRKKNFTPKFISEREKRYRETAKRPGQGGFLPGWMNRLNKFKGTAVKYKVPIIGIIAIGVLATGLYFLVKKR